jgi:hypothetical protein
VSSELPTFDAIQRIVVVDREGVLRHPCSEVGQSDDRLVELSVVAAK